ncbi:MAG: hypothetical protein K6G60_06860 [Lachnospiraceae bacterium]|nr:hypothetical protein [Lachnospiraceae bacterium]
MEFTGRKCFKAFASRGYKIATIIVTVLSVLIGGGAAFFFGSLSMPFIGAVLFIVIGIADYLYASAFNKSNLGCLNFVRSSFWGKLAIRQYLKTDVIYKAVLVSLGYLGSFAVAIMQGGVFECLTCLGTSLAMLFLALKVMKDRCWGVNINMFLIEVGGMLNALVSIVLVSCIALAYEAGFGILAGVTATAVTLALAFLSGRSLYICSARNFEAGYRPTENL